MSIFALIALFLFGLAAGSFLNVVALRYSPNGKLLAASVISGRSECPRCHAPLRFFELIPLLSFLFLRGRCRTCRGAISFRYPLVELLTAIAVAGLGSRLAAAYQVWPIAGGYFPIWFYSLFILWLVVILTLILIALIDLDTYLIPDELNLTLGALGAGIIGLQALVGSFGALAGTFLGHHGMLFGFRDNVFINHLGAAFLSFLLFGAIVLFTRGRGMGLGDVKLISVLGLIFGWPDIILIIFLSFITGSIVALSAMVARRKGMKDVLPFGPFIALGGFLTLYFGETIMDYYFRLFPGA